MIDGFGTRFWDDLAGRIDGPMTFRFVLQPLMGIGFAIRDGIKDAKLGEPAYLWSLFTDPAHRKSRLGSGWHAVSRIFFLAIAMDIVYQWMQFRMVYPGEVLVVAALFGLVPYTLARGPVKRLAELFLRRDAPSPR